MNQQLNDLAVAYYQTELSSTSGDINELELEWLQSLGATSNSNSFISPLVKELQMVTYIETGKAPRLNRLGQPVITPTSLEVMREY